MTSFPHSPIARSFRFLAVVALMTLCICVCPAYGLQATSTASVASLAAADSPTIADVRTLIEALPSCPATTEEDEPAITRAREAYDQLDASERTLLDTETNREALGTTQSYGRVLELAEAGLAVLRPLDNSTTLADGLYTSGISSSWDRGKSASKQDRDWKVLSIAVKGGKARATLQVNSSTYSSVRAGGQVARRSNASAPGESLFTIPISLGKRMVFAAYSQTMATEIAYNLMVSVPAGAKPDAALPTDGGEGDGDDGDQDESTAPQTHVEETTGRIIVEQGTFTHPEIKGYMFRIVAPALVTSDGRNMEVYAQMPSQSYSHLFVGTKAAAEEKSLQEGVDDGSFVVATVAANGEGVMASSFAFPLESLDRDITICLYSVKNQHWVEHELRFNSQDLRRIAEQEDEQLADVIRQMENLPARNTIVPDDEQCEAAVRAVRDAYDALSPEQKAQVPARLLLLLEWDESMFDLGFNTDFLPMATAGQRYDGAIYVSGKNGTEGKHAEIVDGALPEGLGLEVDDAGRWVRIVGTPGSIGSSTFTVRLSNSLGESVSKPFTIHVGYAPRIVTKTLAQARVGSPYDQIVEADAYPDATWNLDSGSLPSGLALIDDGTGANTAHIVGTPIEEGSYTFVLSCDNFANGVELAQYSITVLGKSESSASTQDGDPLPAASKAKVNAKTISAKTVKAALAKAGSTAVSTLVIGSKATRISPKAFKNTGVTTLEVKSTKLTKAGVKNCLKGSKVKTIRVAAPNAKLSKTKKLYTRIFAKKNSGKKVKVV